MVGYPHAQVSELSLSVVRSPLDFVHELSWRAHERVITGFKPYVSKLKPRS